MQDSTRQICSAAKVKTFAEGEPIVDPVRVDWEPGGAFVTPPGKRHSHQNEPGGAAPLIPSRTPASTYRAHPRSPFSGEG